MKNNYFGPVKKFWSFNFLCILSITLIVAVLGQFLMITIKNEKIDQLVAENSSLREKMGDIGINIDRLNDHQNDIRLFQREMVEAIKSIDNLAAVKFINRSIKEPTKEYSNKLTFDHFSQPEFSLTKLDFSIENSRYDNSVLLTKALALKNIVSNIPSLVPTHGYVSSGVGTRIDPFTKKRTRHEGVDLAGPWGSTIYAPADGTVIRAGLHRDFGKMIEIKHPYGLITRFAHLSELLVFKGQRVKREQVIGRLGNTGKRCLGAHLHYEIQQGQKKLNPADFMLSMPSARENLNI